MNRPDTLAAPELRRLVRTVTGVSSLREMAADVLAVEDWSTLHMAWLLYDLIEAARVPRSESLHPNDDQRPYPSGATSPANNDDWVEHEKRKAARMTALCEQFPTLRGQPGVSPWDPVLFGEQVRAPWSGAGAVDAIRFVCGVWNVDHPDARAFRLHSALGRWDDSHRAAFNAWAAHPWWA